MTEPSIAVEETGASSSTSTQKQRPSKPQWFGSTLSAATHASASIPFQPNFPEDLRLAIQPHIDKAITRRDQALKAIRVATQTEGKDYDSLVKSFMESPLSDEGHLSFDPLQHPLRESLKSACGIPEAVDLSQLHTTRNLEKEFLLQHLTQNYHEFQIVYDKFVRKVCCPRLAELWECQDNTTKAKTIYYQCFPCLRFVQPGDFSIGPHADVAYGHHPFTTNFYVLLTDLTANHSSAALFLESRPGGEEWHPILGNYGDITHFAGTICAHWTTENNAPMTRISLDFRLLPGPLYDAMVCGGQEAGGQLDVYRQTPGYYCQCSYNATTKEWERVGPLLPPDARIGFPWTVANWDKLLAKKKKGKRAAT